jgi:hypothetical protein
VFGIADPTLRPRVASINVLSSHVQGVPLGCATAPDTATDATGVADDDAAAEGNVPPEGDDAGAGDAAMDAGGCDAGVAGLTAAEDAGAGVLDAPHAAARRAMAASETRRRAPARRGRSTGGLLV